MKQRIAIAYLLMLPTYALFASNDQQEDRRPNFVFILADDLGCRDLSCEGSTFYESPHIDSIANEGMRFLHGYATCQVCSPSRASIMTGKYPARVGITDYIGAASGEDWKRNDRVLPAEYKRQLPHKETTIAEALRDAGYATFFAGKWHLGGKGSHPEDHGFQHNRGGFFSGSPPGGFFSPFKNPMLENREPGESLPIRLAQETARFIADTEEPFFAFLSFYSVHAPIQTTETLCNKYRDKYQAQATNARDENESTGSRDRFINDRTLPVRQVQDNPIYAGMIESMDDAVGLVLDAIKRRNLDENTVVIFTSDNGGVSSGDAYSTANLPFRGGKGRQWEGGIREPYYIKAPGITSPGSSSRIPVTGADFFPTILELAGVDQMPTQHVDGNSLVRLLKNPSSRALKNRALYWHYPHYGNQGGEPSSIIREGNWKLIHYWEDGRNELYQLDQDIGEQDDLAKMHPDKLIVLWHKLETWLRSVDAKIPEIDTRFDQERKVAHWRQIHTEFKVKLEKRHADYLNPDWSPGPQWWGSQIVED